MNLLGYSIKILEELRDSTEIFTNCCKIVDILFIKLRPISAVFSKLFFPTVVAKYGKKVSGFE